MGALAARSKLRPPPLGLCDRAGGPGLCCLVLVAALKRPCSIDAIADAAARKTVDKMRRPESGNEAWPTNEFRYNVFIVFVGVDELCVTNLTDNR